MAVKQTLSFEQLEQMIDAENTPIIAGNPPLAPPVGQRASSPFLAASIPSSMQLTTDIPPATYPGGLGAYRVMPPIASAEPAVVSAARSAVNPEFVSLQQQITNIVNTALTTIPGGGPAPNQWVFMVTPSGSALLSQPNFSNIAGIVSLSQLPASFSNFSDLCDELHLLWRKVNAIELALLDLGIDTREYEGGKDVN